MNYCFFLKVKYLCTNKCMNQTRMHSSRMRTGRSLTVCWRLLPGGSLLQGGCLVRGSAWSGGWSLLLEAVSGPGGCLVWGEPGLGGVSAPGGCLVRGGGLVWGWGGGSIPACTVDRHTPVKTLPWPNFVAAGKYEGGIFQN